VTNAALESRVWQHEFDREVRVAPLELELDEKIPARAKHLDCRILMICFLAPDHF
jgi:hypothetical protein